jgi:hypothetical protein
MDVPMSRISTASDCRASRGVAESGCDLPKRENEPVKSDAIATPPDAVPRGDDPRLGARKGQQKGKAKSGSSGRFQSSESDASLKRAASEGGLVIAGERVV